MIRLPPDFKEFLQLLNSERVEYLVVGGFAVGYYGYPRATGDMDVWIAISPENIGRIMTVLLRFGFSAASVSADLFLKENQVIRMGVPPVRIEILTSVSGVHFADCFSRRISALIDGIPINLISLDDLKTNKKAAGRHKDLADLEHLP